MSKLDEAEEYLQASWKLTQDGTVASHLCQVYEREHKDALAIKMCRLAVYRIPMSESARLDQAGADTAEAQKRLNHLTSTGKTNTDGASDTVIQERMFRIPRFLPGTESAEFWVLFASDGKGKMFNVADVKFISGSDKMKLQGKRLKTVAFNFPAPSDAPARFVRRGILGCYEYTGCSFMMLDPATVQSLK